MEVVPCAVTSLLVMWAGPSESKLMSDVYDEDTLSNYTSNVCYDISLKSVSCGRKRCVLYSDQWPLLLLHSHPAVATAVTAKATKTRPQHHYQ